MRITSSTSTTYNTSSASSGATTTPSSSETEILSKCAKMTEGEHRILHGMNGVSNNGNGNGNGSRSNTTSGRLNAGAALIVKQDKLDGDGAGGAPGGPTDTFNNLGGRLKFFKNGRFILELARAREGEKVAWVPVPKKTFWPPAGSTSSLSAYRQESSTSLSVSDDNSSIQSSPWQRDHTWKQTSPQRNISENLNFYFINKRQKTPKKSTSKCLQYKLQRCPYLTVSDEQQRTKCKCNNHKCINNIKSAICLRKSLVTVVEFLWNKTLQTFNSITSPRKRILRELERVTIDDDLSIYNKRCRGKIQQKQINNNSNNGIHLNGGCEDVKKNNTGGKNCSYSITSLLGDENNKSSTSQDLKKRQDSPPPHQQQPPIMGYMAPTQFMSPFPLYSSVLHHHPATVTTSSNYISPYYHHHHHPGGSGYAVRPSAFYQPLMTPQPIGPGPRHEAYSPPWNTYEQHHLPLHRDDSSDVPLNLSKHAD